MRHTTLINTLAYEGTRIPECLAGMGQERGWGEACAPSPPSWLAFGSHLPTPFLARTPSLLYQDLVGWGKLEWSYSRYSVVGQIVVTYEEP